MTFNYANVGMWFFWNKKPKTLKKQAWFVYLPRMVLVKSMHGFYHLHAWFLYEPHLVFVVCMHAN